MRDLARIESIVEEKLATMGYELYELKYIRAGSRSIVRLFVDNANGITAKDCETVSHEISVLLDVEDFSQSPYSLEVSSPGIDRPLVTEKDFKRAVGNRIRFRLKGPEGKSSTLNGKLIDCINGVCSVETKKEKKEIPLSTIYSGKIEITFK